MSVEERLSDLLIEWEELRQGGRAVPVEEFCKDYPDLVEALRQRIKALLAMDAVLTDPKAEGLQATRYLPGNQETVARAQLQEIVHEGPTVPPVSLPSPPAGEERQRVAGYEILGELGRGGMGVVYKARQVGLDRLVALKMLLTGSYAGTEKLTRFRREVEAVARLDHPNLVHIYEVGEHEGRAFFSMELVTGGDLHKKLDGKPQPSRKAAQWLEILARALHVVHQQGIVHRDLKPGNVLLTPDGTPKVTDFGLAKRLDATGDPTLSGRIMGTPSYMSPEQAEGKSKQVGPATDIFALGAILYEMLTGRPPFQAETPWDTIIQVVSDDPVPPRRLQHRVPQDLETICLKCLQKEPARRYASAADLADDLARFLADEPIRARPTGALERAIKWARRRPAVAALLAVSCLAALALVVGGVVHSTRLRDALTTTAAQAEESRQRLVRLQVIEGAHSLDEGDWFAALAWFTEALKLDEGHPEREEMHRLRIGAVLNQCPRLERIWNHKGPIRCARFSPDSRFVLTTSEDGKAQVWEVENGKPAGPALRHGDTIFHGEFSPGGQSVVTASKDRTARVWSAGTGQPLTEPLSHQGPVYWASFGNHGRWVVTASEDGTARIWDARTGKPIAGPLKHEAAVHYAEFSPDGKRLVTASDDKTARVWDPATGKQVTLLKHTGPVHQATFHPDGSRVVTACADQTAQVWDAATGKSLLGPLKHFGPVFEARFSRDGLRLVTAGDDHTARVWDAGTGNQLTPALRQASGLHTAAFSADDRDVVTGGDDNMARMWDAKTGIPLTTLLRHNGSVQSAAFSPDGRRLITAGNDGVARLWALDPGGDSGLALMVVPTQRKLADCRSRDGQRLVTEDGDHSLQVREAATNQAIGPALKHGSAILDAEFSPDGRHLVTASDDNTALIWDIQSGECLTQPMRHGGSVYHATFSSDGRLVLTAGTDQFVRVWDAATGEPITPPMPFPGKVVHAVFEADLSQVRVTSSAPHVRIWPLRRDDRPVEELITLAQVLAGSRVDPARGLLPLDADALQRAWQSLSVSNPKGFFPDHQGMGKKH